MRFPHGIILFTDAIFRRQAFFFIETKNNNKFHSVMYIVTMEKL